VHTLPQDMTCRSVAGRVEAGLALATLARAGQGAESAEALRPWTEYRTILWVGDSVWQKPDQPI